jgi:TolA-binding protein
MNGSVHRSSDEDLAFDARFAAALPPGGIDDLAHARSRQALVRAAEARLARPASRSGRLRIVTALAFAATTALAAVATHAYVAAHSAPQERAIESAAARESEASRPAAPAHGLEPSPIAQATDVPHEAPHEHGTTSRHHAPLAAPRLEPPPPDPRAPTPGERFAEAMRAYLAGDFATAEARFDAFCIDHADDTRAEDAAFLRAEARARHGDFQGARAAARAYLRRYPDGLRRLDAERIAGIGLE